MTRTKRSSLFLICALALAAVAFLLWQRAENGSAGPSGTGAKTDYSRLEKEALLKISGVPDDIKIEGEINIDGTLHPLSLLAAIPGQRAYGIDGPKDIRTNNYQIEIRLIDSDGGSIRDVLWSVSGKQAPYDIGISLDGFDAGGAATVSLNGRVAVPATRLDWNGRIAMKQTTDKTDIIQIGILPNEYETYVITAGNFLPYYLQDFENPGQTLNGLAPFNFGDETTTAESNKLAKALQSGAGRPIGWWANDAKTVLVARLLNNDCNSACTTSIFLKNGDQWNTAFSEGIDSLWLDRETIGRPGSEFYTVVGSNPTNRWVLKDDRYVLFDEPEGGAS